MDKREKSILKTQEIKNINIAYFNALNAAIAFLPEKLKGTKEGFKKVGEWADKFYERWQMFYLDNVLPRTMTEREKEAYDNDKYIEQVRQWLEEEKNRENDEWKRRKNEDDVVPGLEKKDEIPPEEARADDDLKT